MTADDEITRVRVLVRTNDGAGLVAALAEPWPEDCLQLIGDGLVDAVETGVDGAGDLVVRCITALRRRDWTGDSELVDALGAALGIEELPALTGLPVDLEELASALEGDPIYGGGRIDLRTGEVRHGNDFELDEDGDEDEDDDQDRWLPIECEGSRPGYEDMEMFIERLDDARLRERLYRAISGRGAFRRFKDALADHSDLLPRWYAFSNDRQRGRARSWLRIEGYVTTLRG